MNALRRLAVNAKPINGFLAESHMWNWNDFRMAQSKRTMMGETYEGTGKTTGYIMNKPGTEVLCIDYISTDGFKLTNGWTVFGSTIFFPHTMFGWNVKSFEDLNEESLALFSLITPKPDCLFLGYGYKGDLTHSKLKEIMSFFKKMEVRVDILETETAAATFNFCSLDNRFVAAALIPPKKITSRHELFLPSENDKIMLLEF